MGPTKTETATVFSNTTRSVFYCSHAPHIIWDLQDTTSPWVFVAVALPPAVLLNALIHVIIAVKRRRELKRTSNILLSSLAVTDLLVGSLCVPLSAVVGLLVSYQVLTDHYICVLDFVAISSTVILTICSIFHLTMMARERYGAIRKWIDYKVMVTQSLMKKLTIMAWVSAIVTVSPPHFIMAFAGTMRDNDRLLALKIFHIVVSVLVLFALGLIVVYLGVRKRKLSQFAKSARPAS